MIVQLITMIARKWQRKIQGWMCHIEQDSAMKMLDKDGVKRQAAT